MHHLEIRIMPGADSEIRDDHGELLGMVSKNKLGKWDLVNKTGQIIAAFNDQEDATTAVDFAPNARKYLRC